MERVEIEENDVVLAMSDGVIDNLWEHEIVTCVVNSIEKWEAGSGGVSTGDRKFGAGGGMDFVAEELMNAARVIAQDPFAESPFMEHAVEEGLAMEGGMPICNLQFSTLTNL
jgi:protein phosphatase PTC7